MKKACLTNREAGLFFCHKNQKLKLLAAYQKTAAHQQSNFAACETEGKMDC